MSDFKGAQKLFDHMDFLLELLEKEENADLYAVEKCNDLKKIRRDFKAALERESEKGRKLSIGIIGDIKAGKSTFLNSLIFNGRDVLPKAATPMTAALTRITYSENPKAVIHFYSSEDWDSIESDSKEFDREMGKKYKAYQEKYDIKKKGGNVNIGKPMSYEDFTRKYSSSIEELYKSAKELTDMVKVRGNVTDRLGKSVEIPYSTMSDLDDYVGAKGRYTPIVNYVELQVNDEALDGFEIVDTPGLNDPVKSRSLKTKEFLSKCDVAVILSPVGQFLPANTMRNINMRLPSEGIKHFIIVGSKLDEGLRQIPEIKKQKTFLQAYRLCIDEYKEIYAANISKVKKEGIVGGTQMYDEPVFISSAFYTMFLKMKNGLPLSNEEQKIIEAIKKEYPDLGTDATSLGQYSGFRTVNERLSKLYSEKAEIIEEHSRGITDTYSNKLFGVTEELISDTASRLERLRNSDIEELKARMDEATRAIDSARARIKNEFNIAANESLKRIFQIKTVLQNEMPRHTHFNKETRTSHESKVEHTGFLGLKKQIHHWEATHYSASVSQIDSNITGYIAKCNENVTQELDHLLQWDSVKKTITTIMLDAFEKAGGNIAEEDITAPLRELFSKLTVPGINVMPHGYINEIHSQFTSGAAEDNEIHALSNLQQSVLIQIYEDFAAQLDDRSEIVRNILEEQAVKFADDLEIRISGELEVLSRQADEKELNLKRYETFLKALKDNKKTYREI